jgi:hypothetical protein
MKALQIGLCGATQICPDFWAAHKSSAAARGAAEGCLQSRVRYGRVGKLGFSAERSQMLRRGDGGGL